MSELPVVPWNILIVQIKRICALTQIVLIIKLHKCNPGIQMIVFLEQFSFLLLLYILELSTVHQSIHS